MKTTKLKAGTIKRVHVSQPNLRANMKDGGNRPVFSVQTSKGVFHGNNIEIDGLVTFVNSQHKPLSCGARIWVVTKDAVTLKE